MAVDREFEIYGGRERTFLEKNDEAQMSMPGRTPAPDEAIPST